VQAHGVLPDDGYALQLVRVERQHLPLVLEQDDALFGYAPRRRLVLLRVERAAGPLAVEDERGEHLAEVASHLVVEE
jgi:hypothetical protein